MLHIYIDIDIHVYVYVYIFVYHFKGCQTLLEAASNKRARSVDIRVPLRFREGDPGFSSTPDRSRPRCGHTFATARDAVHAQIWELSAAPRVFPGCCKCWIGDDRCQRFVSLHLDLLGVWGVRAQRMSRFRPCSPCRLQELSRNPRLGPESPEFKRAGKPCKEACAWWEKGAP